MTDSAPVPDGPLEVVMVSYALTQEAGGPGVAAVGFARGLARLGVRVTLLALDNKRGTWLIDDEQARVDGIAFARLRSRGYGTDIAALVWRLGRMPRVAAANRVVWVNGIWGAQSVAAGIYARATGHPLAVRPAGSLGTAALTYKSAKKRLYYRAIEGPIMRSAAGIHCMSAKELDELPLELRGRAFVVPSGVDLPSTPPTRDSLESAQIVVGCLARIHPIKRQHLVLEAVASLRNHGLDIAVELAGSVSDEDYAGRLERLVAETPELRDRVRFLGHVAHNDLGEVLKRWRAAVLVSEQENFGHAVVTAAAHSVPMVVSEGVALARDLVASHAGVITEPSSNAVARAITEVVAWPGAESAETCRAFTKRYSWGELSARLVEQLRRAAMPH